MRLAEKIRNLRETEGAVRGLGRPMTQVELVEAIGEELGSSISQSYLSQIESGARPHLTATTRGLLARFFKVHPGYLVDDPPGYHEELTSELRELESRMDVWLMQGAERFGHDPEVQAVLVKLAKRPDSRKFFLLLGELLQAPDVVQRLSALLKHERTGSRRRQRERSERR